MNPLIKFEIVIYKIFMSLSKNQSLQCARLRTPPHSLWRRAKCNTNKGGKWSLREKNEQKSDIQKSCLENEKCEWGWLRRCGYGTGPWESLVESQTRNLKLRICLSRGRLNLELCLVIALLLIGGILRILKNKFRLLGIEKFLEVRSQPSCQYFSEFTRRCFDLL